MSIFVCILSSWYKPLRLPSHPQMDLTSPSHGLLAVLAGPESKPPSSSLMCTGVSQHFMDEQTEAMGDQGLEAEEHSSLVLCLVLVIGAFCTVLHCFVLHGRQKRCPSP